MISIQNMLSLKQGRKTFSNSNNKNPATKKRKWQQQEADDDHDDKEERDHDQEDHDDDVDHLIMTKVKYGSELGKSTVPILDIDLHLQTPLPIDWQRCLNLQSGQVHFYNTRTQKRTCRDPRRSPEPVSSRIMSLDLELNLPFDSFLADDHEDNEQIKTSTTLPDPNPTDYHSSKSKLKPNLSRSLSWVSLEVDDQQEMMAAVCARCHMLVMLCKSSPACPNCKFMNPTSQS